MRPKHCRNIDTPSLPLLVCLTFFFFWFDEHVDVALSGKVSIHVVLEKRIRVSFLKDGSSTDSLFLSVSREKKEEWNRDWTVYIEQALRRYYSGAAIILVLILHKVAVEMAGDKKLGTSTFVAASPPLCIQCLLLEFVFFWERRNS